MDGPPAETGVKDDVHLFMWEVGTREQIEAAIRVQDSRLRCTLTTWRRADEDPSIGGS